MKKIPLQFKKHFYASVKFKRKIPGNFSETYTTADKTYWNADDADVTDIHG